MWYTHPIGQLWDCRRPSQAGMAELADAHGSGPCEGYFMEVRVLLPAPKQYDPSQIFFVGDGLGSFVYSGKFEEAAFAMWGQAGLHTAFSGGGTAVAFDLIQGRVLPPALFPLAGRVVKR